jgi:acyl-CoA reductase-like NAD-dependent aldehyde dehydrogenase
MEPFDLWIDGQDISAVENRRFTVLSPATGEPVASVAAAGSDDLERAVRAARNAFREWSARTAYDREKVIRTATAHVRKQADAIGMWMAKEQGKPFNQSRSEVIGSCDTLDYFAAEGPRIEGYSNPTEAVNLRSWVIYQPVGVCGLITPWNYPVSLLSWKLGPMLASGCTGIVKPPPETPISPLLFCRALTAGGLPPGVVNVLTGQDASLGAELVAHPGVAKIAMTGSTATGKKILVACAADLKKVSLELGGQCPAVVCADADVDLAAKLIAYKGFRNMGQSCSTVNRVYVHRSQHDTLAEKLKELGKKMTIGDGVTDGAVDLGPMTTAAAREKVRRHVADALDKGASLLCGGSAPEGDIYTHGNFYLPTVLTGCKSDMLVLREETFGPVVPLVPFDSVDEAIALANDSAFGLVAYLFTRDFTTTMKVSEALEAGTVCVNNGAVNTNYGPYEGWKDSGYGAELGRRSIFEYLKTKHIKVQIG